MAAIDERKVQGAALHYLHSRYAIQHPEKPFFVDAEKRVRYKKSVSRADGLICYPLSANSFYTISLEAKSIKTWNNLEVFNWDERLAWEMLGSCLLTSILSVAFTWYMPWYWMLIITMVALAIVASIIAYYANSTRYVQAEVFAQLKKYAANERWVALSSEVHDLLVAKMQVQHFEGLCKQHRCGLLIVNRLGRVEELIAPIASKGQFLDNYLAADNIKSALNQSLTTDNYRSCAKWVGKGQRKISSFLCSNPGMIAISSS